MANKQSYVDEINRIRTNPTSVIPELQQRAAAYQGTLLKRPGAVDLMTQEGAAVVMETIEFLKKQSAVAPVTLDDLLSAAAQDHANDIGPKGITAHDGSDGSTTKSRIEKHCDWKVRYLINH
jgi:uncharacterized protein YkwD